jgi:hypothetical protein
MDPRWGILRREIFSVSEKEGNVVAGKAGGEKAAKALAS